MSTQVQIRGNSQATQEARILASRELDINTTDSRLCVHNGSMAGGVRHVNCYDQQNSEFNYAAASGTNALTASMRVAPLSYVTGALYVIKIANTNTGSVTININSLGAKTLKKYQNGVLSNLESGDLIAGAVIQIVYDGTYFQIVGLSQSTDRLPWTPTRVSSYYASNCVYVDLGYAVILSYDVETAHEYDFSYIIGNLPFTAETQVNLPFPSGLNIKEAMLTQGNTAIDFNLLSGTGSTQVNLKGTFAYIKD